MPIYCYRCTNCGVRWAGDFAGHHCEANGPVVRDYRAENVGVHREAPKAPTSDILPTAKDFERPEDPTGVKGMRNWMNTHEPRPGNKNPRWPTLSERTGV